MNDDWNNNSFEVRMKSVGSEFAAQTGDSEPSIDFMYGENEYKLNPEVASGKGLNMLVIAPGGDDLLLEENFDVTKDEARRTAFTAALTGRAEGDIIMIVAHDYTDSDIWIEDAAQQAIQEMGGKLDLNHEAHAYAFVGIFGADVGHDAHASDLNEVDVVYQMAIKSHIDLGGDKCSACASGQRPSRDNKSCVSVHCGVSQFFRQDLFCPQCDWCPEGFITSEDGTTCVKRAVPVCKANEKPTPDGLGCMPKCGPLEELYQGECRVKCGPNEYRNGDRCVIRCGPGKEPTPDGHGCMDVVGVDDEICKRGYVKVRGRGCYKIYCGDDAMLNEAGTGCIGFLGWVNHCNAR
jgi:hypothetical protein